MSENDGGTNQRNMYASSVGTMAPSNLRYWGGGVRGKKRYVHLVVYLIPLPNGCVKLICRGRKEKTIVDW